MVGKKAEIKKNASVKKTSIPENSKAPIGRRERSKRDKWTRISNAARTLFEKQGFSRTTTQQIAEMADIGTGTLFLYAESKEDLLTMVFKDEMQEKAEEIFGNLSISGSTIDQIMSIFSQMVDYHNKDIELSQILHKDMAHPPSIQRARVVTDLLYTILEGLENFITLSKDSGNVPQRIDAGLAAQTLFSIYYFGLIRWLSGLDSRIRFLANLRSQIIQVLDLPETEVGIE